MKNTYVLISVICLLAGVKAFSEEVKSPYDDVVTVNFNGSRVGFSDLTDYSANSNKPMSCRFKVADTAGAKKAVFELLAKLNKFMDERAKFDHETGEGFAEYERDITLFVDSCEDKAAISLFPGPITAKKYPRQTLEALLAKAETKGLDGYNEGVMTELAMQFKDTDKKSYERAKNVLIKNVDNERKSEIALIDLERLNDPDLIPVFEKVSKYPDSKGRAVYDMKGGKRIEPISGIAKKALKKLKLRAERRAKGLPENDPTEGE